MSDKAVYIAIIITLIFLWWPSRHLPSFWDSSGYTMPVADYIYHHEFRLPPPPQISIHPPLYMYSLAASWLLFGQSLLAAHILTFIYGLIYVFSAYQLGRLFLGRLSGIILTLLVISTPVFISQLSALYVDLPVAALSLAGFVATEKKRWRSASVILTIALLIKTTALPFILCFLIQSLIHKRYKTPKKLTWTLLPIFAFIAWSFVKYQVYGSWFISDRLKSYTIDKWSVTHILKTGTAFVNHLTTRQYRQYISIAIYWGFLSLLNSPSKNTLFLKKISKILTIGFFYYLFFGLFTIFHIKYALTYLPLFYLLGLISLYFGHYHLKKHFHSPLPGFIISIFLLGSFTYHSLTSLHPTYQGPKDIPLYTSQENSPTYLDMQQNWIQAAQYLQTNYSQATIAGGFPEFIELTHPYQGYVHTPLDAHLCSTFSPEATNSAIIYYHPYSLATNACQSLIQKHDSTLLKEFQNHGWWLELYQVTFSPPTNTL